MITREQENAIEQLALQYPRVHVHYGWADHSVEATVPSGQNFRINEDGRIIKTDVNFSINWRQ